MGCFRQGYQSLRESISHNRALNWSRHDTPEYLAFKRLATHLALYIAEASTNREIVEDAFVAVTDNKWETKWSFYGQLQEEDPQLYAFLRRDPRRRDLKKLRKVKKREEQLKAAKRFP